MARSKDAPFEMLARSTSKEDWARVNPKDKSKRYQYRYNPSVTISYRHFREWPGSLSGWQSERFDTLADLLQFVARFGRSLRHIGYINAYGEFKQGYPGRGNDTHGWRNIVPTTIFSAMLIPNFYTSTTDIAASIFVEVQEWGLMWRPR